MTESKHQEEIAMINVCAPNKRDWSYMKQNLNELKKEINSTFIVGDYNILLSVIDRTAKWKKQ